MKPNNVLWEELVRLPIVTMQDVMRARFVGRTEAGKLGFTPLALTRIATAISEITRNVVQHAGAPGEIWLARAGEGDRQGLRITVADKGKGIENPEQLSSESQASTLGAGLPGTRRLMDSFCIQSTRGAGTVVTTEIWTQNGHE